MSRSYRSIGPLSRRQFMHVGGLASCGLTLAQALRARANVARRLDNSVILLYLHGGPSQLETYDLKPNAPLDYRSLFAPIRTTVPGMEICEHLPLHAKVADKFSLIRSMHHDVNIHSDGGIVVLTGKRPTKLDPTSQSKSEHPDFGSVTSHMRGLGPNVVPPYVAIPSRLYMTRPTYLGAHHRPFELGDPSAEKYRSPILGMTSPDGVRGLEDRKSLLRSLDQFRRSADAAGAIDAVDEYQQVAFDILTSPRVSTAFDLSREDPALRDRYGRHLWGQGCLLARRLAEAGVGVISLYINTPRSGQEFTNWDDHILNAGRPGHFASYMKRRLPYYDQALATLIDDIYQRQLHEKILVVAMGEFGRTPRLSRNQHGVGRDHWPDAYSVLVSGGGLRMGQVIGATNAKAEYPVESAHSPQDLLATLYRHLGVDYHQPLVDHAGRPIPILGEGVPIASLM